jgi:hypothetical protein
LVPAILFAVPALGGIVCAAFFCCVRNFLPQRRVLGCLASFVVGAGLGAGVTATAMHVSGIRVSELKWLYEDPLRNYLRTMQTLQPSEAPDRFRDDKESPQAEYKNG